MKHIIYILSFITLLMSACLKDTSTLNMYEVSEIGIDTTGLPIAYTIYQRDTLKIAPTVSVQNTDKGTLKYKWTLNAYGGYERLLGTQEHLSAIINETPSSTPYKLIFTATDSTNNVKAFFTWDITVISLFGDGLIVADTKDEQNTDVSLIMAFNFTGAITKDSASQKIMYNAYSSANGEKIKGIVNQLNFHRRFSYKDITFMTDQSYLRINPDSYIKTQGGNELFIIPPDKLAPNDVSTVVNNNHRQFLINNGKVYGRYGENQKFGYYFLPSDDKGYKAFRVCGFNTGLGGITYDELNNRFLLVADAASMDRPLINFPATHNEATFDPNNMGNKTCLDMFEGYDQRIISIMKERDQEKYYAYQIKRSNPVSGSMGIAVNDLSANPDISNAKFFSTSSSEQVLFYATEDKVYATIVELGVPSTTNLRYTANSGEKITGMKIIFTSNGKTYIPSTSDPLDWSKRTTIGAAQRLVVLSTYNASSKTGKIITIPIEILGVGGLVTNPDYIRTYEGFGRITAFDMQLP